MEALDFDPKCLRNEYRLKVSCRVENTADWKEIPSIGARGGGGKRQGWPAVLGTVIPAVGLMCPKRPAERRSRWSDKPLEIELNLFLFFYSFLLSF
jgi:hypothetical protein